MRLTYRALGSTFVTTTTWIKRRAGQLARFGVVGAVGVVVNLGVFNLLRLGPLAADVEVAGSDNRVVTAKIIATIVSILFAWAAHRGWTFRGGKRHRTSRELVLFAVVNAIALIIEAGTLAISHHGLGLTSVLADNISSLIGIGLGTIARYAGYSLWVFSSDVSGSDNAPVIADDSA